MKLPGCFYRTIAYILLVGAASALLASCDMAIDAPSAEETTTQTTAAALSPPPQAVSSLFGVPYYDRGAPLNPLTEASQMNRDICSLLFDTLFRVDASFQAAASLCTSVGTSASALTLTIREGVLFHDGSLMTAADVVYSLNLAMNEESSIYKSRFDGVSAISLDAQNRVVLTLTGEHPSLTAELDIPIIKQGTGYDRDAVGTGRYRMLETDGQRYLVPNTSHFTGQGSGAQMTHMQLTEAADADALVYGVTSGNIDILRTAEALSADIVLRADADRYTVETTELLYAGFGSHNAVFDHIRVRTALAEIIRAALSDRVTAAPMLFHPRLGYAAQASAAADEPYTPELRLATALLQTGWRRDADNVFLAADGSALTLRLLTDSADRDASLAAETVADSLRSVGIAAELIQKTGDAYDSAIRSKQFDIYLGAYDAGNDFDFSGLLTTDSAAAVTGATDGDLDLLLAAYVQVGTADGELVARQIGERLAAKLRIVPIGYRRDEVLLNRKFRISNVTMTADDIFYNVYDWTRAK